MPARTGRPKAIDSATVSARVPDTLASAVDAVADARGRGRNDAIQYLLERGLDAARSKLAIGKTAIIVREGSVEVRARIAADDHEWRERFARLCVAYEVACEREMKGVEN